MKDSLTGIGWYSQLVIVYQENGGMNCITLLNYRGSTRTTDLERRSIFFGSDYFALQNSAIALNRIFTYPSLSQGYKLFVDWLQIFAEYASC